MHNQTITTHGKQQKYFGKGRRREVYVRTVSVMFEIWSRDCKQSI